MSTVGLLILRVVIAVVCVLHGAHVLFAAYGGAGTGIGPGGLDAAATGFSAIGLPGYPMAVLAGLTQLLGGVLLLVGYLTRWAAIALAAFVAILGWKSQLQWGFFLNWVGEPGRGHGYEFTLVLTAALVCLALSGGGDWSVDGRLARRASYLAAGRARLRRG